MGPKCCHWEKSAIDLLSYNSGGEIYPAVHEDQGLGLFAIVVPVELPPPAIAVLVNGVNNEFSEDGVEREDNKVGGAGSGRDDGSYGEGSEG